MHTPTQPPLYFTPPPRHVNYPLRFHTEHGLWYVLESPYASECPYIYIYIYIDVYIDINRLSFQRSMRMGDIESGVGGLEGGMGKPDNGEE